MGVGTLEICLYGKASSLISRESKGTRSKTLLDLD